MESRGQAQNAWDPSVTEATTGAAAGSPGRGEGLGPRGQDGEKTTRPQWFPCWGSGGHREGPPATRRTTVRPRASQRSSGQHRGSRLGTHDSQACSGPSRGQQGQTPGERCGPGGSRGARPWAESAPKPRPHRLFPSQPTIGCTESRRWVPAANEDTPCFPHSALWDAGARGQGAAHALW